IALFSPTSFSHLLVSLLRHPRPFPLFPYTTLFRSQRLRISKYLEAPPKNMGQDSLVLRLEYLDAKNTLGFLELFKVPSEPGDESKDRYLVRTEHTRWYGEVLGSTAEQVERDVQSVVSSKSESSK